MIAIVDYGVGNLFSLSSSLKYIGKDAIITNDSKVLEKADHIILPGVGAYGDAINKLNATGLVPVLNDKVKEGTPFLGICLGHQLLFEYGEEYGIHKGLGYLKGRVKDMKTMLEKIGNTNLKVPQMGWNSLKIVNNSPILKGLTGGEYVYFVHSYSATDCQSSTVAIVDYGMPIVACVNKDNVFGCQFHPEKSGEVGLKILNNFAEL